MNSNNVYITWYNIRLLYKISMTRRWLESHIVTREISLEHEIVINDLFQNVFFHLANLEIVL
jgi:hypothetical protein